MAANSNKEPNLQDDLLSFETLDRASPDLWPEQIPGVSTFAANKSPSANTNPPKWMADLENDDINLLQEFGSLTTSQLMEKVKGLQNLAYQLGLDEDMRPHMTLIRFLKYNTCMMYPKNLYTQITAVNNLSLEPDAREMTRGKFLQILQRPNKRQ